MCTVEPGWWRGMRSDGPLLSNCPLSFLFHYDLLNSLFVSVGKLLKMMLLKRNQILTFFRWRNYFLLTDFDSWQLEGERCDGCRPRGLGRWSWPIGARPGQAVLRSSDPPDWEWGLRTRISVQTGVSRIGNLQGGQPAVCLSSSQNTPPDEPSHSLSHTLPPAL